ncbi:hypothetical protein C5167_041471 [Papaver somniferum]|nr:hypothetical protein C5167_041471 [Papaver somniferum]
MIFRTPTSTSRSNTRGIQDGCSSNKLPLSVDDVRDLDVLIISVSFEYCYTTTHSDTTYIGNKMYRLVLQQDAMQLKHQKEQEKKNINQVIK